jgi:VanZ family protein
MPTPRLLTKAARLVLLCGAIGVVILTLGPFQGAEEMFLLNDKSAHAIAFGSLTAVAFIAFPRLRRFDMARTVVLLGGAIELAQLVTGRSASLTDWLADVAGVAMIYLPSQIEVLRRLARERGDDSFALIHEQDRRRVRRRRPGQQEAPAMTTGA